MSNASILSDVLDGLAAWKETTLTAEQKLEIAREFTGMWDEGISNEDLAANFLAALTKYIKAQGRRNLKDQRDIRLYDEELAELDAGSCNIA